MTNKEDKDASSSPHQSVSQENTFEVHLLFHSTFQVHLPFSFLKLAQEMEYADDITLIADYTHNLQQALIEWKAELRRASTIK